MSIYVFKCTHLVLLMEFHYTKSIWMVSLSGGITCAREFLVHIPPTIPPEVRSLIANSLQAIPPPKQACSDQPVWMNFISGNLSMGLAWNSLRIRGLPCDWHKVVWLKLMFPTRYFFARLCLKSTPTSIWTQRLGIHLSFACPLCLRNEESESHLFFLCQIITQAWS